MNYLPFAGYWFYGAADDTERAAFMSSWGLLDTAPSAVAAVVPIFWMHLRRIFCD